MSGVPRVRSMDVADSEARPVLGPAGNKTQRFFGARTHISNSKPMRSIEFLPHEASPEEVKRALSLSSSSTDIPLSSPPFHSKSVPSILRRHESLLSSLSLSASCSSDASTDSFQSRASTGRIHRSSTSRGRRPSVSKHRSPVISSGISESLADGLQAKKRCSWVTPSTDSSYATFHDEEWGVPVHDDRKLFELLVFSGALAELTWPVILRKRHTFREVFADFDPMTVAKFNEKKIVAPGSTAASLLSELKLRAIIENARQMSKVISEFGSFNKYIWSFVNHKPIISRFRYPRQVPVKTPKADVISKDLVRRGFRSVGPTVIYSFMQVAGITNDHLIGCFRFQDCISLAAEQEEERQSFNDKAGENRSTEELVSEVSISLDELNFSSE